MCGCKTESKQTLNEKHFCWCYQAGEKKLLTKTLSLSRKNKSRQHEANLNVNFNVKDNTLPTARKLRKLCDEGEQLCVHHPDLHQK